LFGTVAEIVLVHASRLSLARDGIGYPTGTGKLLLRMNGHVIDHTPER
jgi:hypothetical protein